MFAQDVMVLVSALLTDIPSAQNVLGAVFCSFVHIPMRQSNQHAIKNRIIQGILYLAEKVLARQRPTMIRAAGTTDKLAT